ncbi:MAG: AAA family ATPase [Saprospiraceae bacterium]
MEDNTPITGSKNFKFKELKVYSSTEYLDENKKKYRQVFDSSQTAYIYAEVSFYNKLFDRENWEANIEFRCFEIKNLKKQICNLDFKKKISKFDNIVFIREGWGNKKEGLFWKKGTYYWEIWLEGEKIATKYFYVENPGKNLISMDENPFVRLQSLRLYEGHYDDVMEEERTYMTSFSAEETRYIYAEIVLNNQLKNDDWHCEMFFKFYNESRELKGQVIRLQNIKKGEENIKITAGWGANTKGSWKNGQFSLEVVFMDKLLAMIHFNVGDEFVHGESVVHVPYGTSGYMIADTTFNVSFEQLFEKLDNMIGLNQIKTKVREHAKYIEFVKMRKMKGFKEEEPLHIHLVFTGNPGTGKTTVAKMMGMLYKKMGMLSKGHVVEVDRGDLVGEYIGQTAPKVKEALEKARGGVLFIDEAYALARANDDNKDFGKEVVEMLIKEMSNGKGDLSIVVAGYPKEMHHFINSNPGLKSRFKHIFEFPDYLPQELNQIALYTAKLKEVNFSDAALEVLNGIITEAYRDRDRTFGNARFVYDLVDKAKINMALRVMSKTTKTKYSRKELSEIQISDIQNLIPVTHKLLPTIPIDEKLLQLTLGELDQLIGIDNIKRQILEMVDIVRYYRENNKNVLSFFSLHTIFIGNPGTGKTTVARIISKIYKALGILERGHMVETDRQGLVAGFVGQTAIKTAEKVDEALGGVLFIDEAYALSNFNGLQGDFGNEAIQTLLKRMEDQRGGFFIFVAGYPDNMETFLKANPGLSSRFDKTLRFEDYNPEQLVLIAKKMMADEGYKLQVKSGELLSTFLRELYHSRDKYFGNARTVRKIVFELIKNQNLRAKLIDSDKRKKSDVTTITIEDVNIVIQHYSDDTKSLRQTIGYR